MNVALGLDPAPHLHEAEAPDAREPRAVEDAVEATYDLLVGRVVEPVELQPRELGGDGRVTAG